MKISFIRPAQEAPKTIYPELQRWMPSEISCLTPGPMLASLGGQTTAEHEIAYHDDHATPFPLRTEADVYVMDVPAAGAPAAMRIGEALLDAGHQVVMVGHFAKHMPHVLREACSAVVMGEPESVWPLLLDDAAQRRLRPRYHAEPVMDLKLLRRARLDLYLRAETDHHVPLRYPVELYRGCPLRCEACGRPQGRERTLRFHAPELIAKALQGLHKVGRGAVLHACPSLLAAQTSRPSLRQILDMSRQTSSSATQRSHHELRLNVPSLLRMDDTTLQQVCNAGIRRIAVVAGQDRISRDGFGMGNPKAIRHILDAMDRAHSAGFMVHVSARVGLRTDDAGVFDRILDVLDVTGVSTADFEIAAPQPGTPPWTALEREGRIIDRSWGHYNGAHCIHRPSRMSVEEVTEGYLYLWREFYRTRTPEAAPSTQRQA